MSAPGDFGAELTVAILAARRAATAILERRARHEVSTKADGTPVTSADLAADAVIRATLREAFPGDAILTEEGVDDPVRLTHRRCWIADPLDGTSYFVAGGDDFDTFVALAVDGVPIVAVALQPATGLLLGAVAGRGAWMQEGDGPRHRLSLSPVTARRVATKDWLGAPGNLAALEAVATGVNASVLRPEFSLCPRCFVPPQPSIDAIVGLPVAAPIRAWEWDIAAIDLIVREAGGAASDLGGAPLRYNQPEPRFASGLVIAADADLHRDLTAALPRSLLAPRSSGSVRSDREGPKA